MAAAALERALQTPVKPARKSELSHGWNQLGQAINSAELQLLSAQFAAAADQAASVLSKTLYLPESGLVQTRAAFVLLQALYEHHRFEQAWPALEQHYGSLQAVNAEVFLLWAALSLDTEQVAPAQQRVAEYLEGAQLVASAGASMPKTPAKGLPHPGAQLSAEQYEAAARLYAVVLLSEAQKQFGEARRWVEQGAHLLASPQKKVLLGEISAAEDKHKQASAPLNTSMRSKGRGPLTQASLGGAEWAFDQGGAQGLRVGRRPPVQAARPPRQAPQAQGPSLWTVGAVMAAVHTFLQLKGGQIANAQLSAWQTYALLAACTLLAYVVLVDRTIPARVIRRTRAWLSHEVGGLVRTGFSLNPNALSIGRIPYPATVGLAAVLGWGASGKPGEVPNVGTVHLHRGLAEKVPS